MYYAHFILSKKGPLAKIWLAAHWDKKLTKAQIYETNIESTIETILEPKMKLALRTSGHLLLGVCRIYSRKVKYLLADCNEAFVKIKMAFRPGLIDLPREKQQASADAITLQEKFPDFDINFVDINMEDIDLSKNVMTQQARIEDITLKEDYGNAMITQDDDFGDMGFGMNTMFMNDDFMNMNEREERFRNNMDRDFNDDFNHESTHNVFNDKTSMRDVDQMETDALDRNNELELGDNTFARASELGPESEQPAIVPTLFEDQPTVLATINQNNNNADEPLNKVARLDDEDEEGRNKENQIQQKPKTTRRKKKLIIDELKEIDSVTMKAQLNDTAAIMSTLELAPPTRKLMQLKESGSIDRLLMSTSRPLTCAILQKLYTSNMITKKMEAIIGGKDDNKENRMQNSIFDENTSMMSMQERQRDNRGDSTGADKLPLMDSLVDNDVTKHSNLMHMGGDMTIDGNNIDGDTHLAGGGSGNNTLVRDPFNPSDLEMTQAQLEATPPHQKSKTANQSHRKSGATNVTTFNNEQLIDDDNEGESNKILNKRAKTMVSLLNKSLTKHANIGFFELTKRNGRKQVAQKFYSLLILKKYDAIEVTQVESFGDIIITKSGKFDNFVSC